MLSIWLEKVKKNKSKESKTLRKIIKIKKEINKIENKHAVKRNK